jgi:integrase
MSVIVRPYRRGGWEVDVTIRLPNGSRFRERSKCSASSRSAAQRWGEERERHLLQHGPAQPRKEVPTLEEFAPRFVDGYAVANRLKPSGIVSKASIIRVHLIPLLGSKKLDAITNENVQRVKRELVDHAAKTANNVLTVLNVLLKKAVEWDVIERMPCTVRLLPIPKPSAGFYDFDEYERLVAAAQDGNALLIVLLGGEAGLRCGEMIGLRWDDVDPVKRQVTVERSDRRGHVGVPKVGRLRHVPLTIRLANALRQHRHLRGPLVVCQADGSSLTHNMVSDAVRRTARRAHLNVSGVQPASAHVLFAPGDAWGAGAGHSGARRTPGPDDDAALHAPEPAAIDGAIRLLDQSRAGHEVGDISETVGGEKAN